METRSISVAGMSCDHCARAVQAEVGKIPGVADVDVDVAAGRVLITAKPLPDDVAEEIRRAMQRDECAETKMLTRVRLILRRVLASEPVA